MCADAIERTRRGAHGLEARLHDRLVSGPRCGDPHSRASPRTCWPGGSRSESARIGERQLTSRPRARVCVLAILLCLVFPAAGGAQEPAAPAPLTEALKAALTASALKRVVGERYFKDTHGDLVTVRCTLDDSKKPAALKCRVEFRAVGAMRRESLTLRCTLGLDGRVRESGFVLIRGRNRTEADGTVGDGTLVFAVRETANSKTESRAVTVPWPADALPYTVAAFVMLVVVAGADDSAASPSALDASSEIAVRRFSGVAFHFA